MPALGRRFEKNVQSAAGANLKGLWRFVGEPRQVRHFRSSVPRRSRVSSSWKKIVDLCAAHSRIAVAFRRSRSIIFAN